MSHSSQTTPVPPIVRPRRRIMIFAITIGCTVPLTPHITRAAGLTDLSDTLSQTVTQVTNQALNPIQQVLGGGSGGWNEQIGGKSSGDLIGDILGGQTGGSFNPFQLILQNFDSFLKSLLNQIMGNQCGPMNENPSCSGGGGTGTIGGNPDTSAGSTNGQPIETGALGLPDPTATHQKINQGTIPNGGTSALQPQDQFNLNPTALAYSLRSDSDRISSRGVAETVIGTTGQAQMKLESQAAAEKLAEIEKTSTDAQEKDVTQDVMKNLATMQSANSTLVAGSYAQLMGLRQQTAANGVVTANISEGIDEANRTQHAERMGAAISVLSGAGGLYLPGQ